MRDDLSKLPVGFLKKNKLPENGIDLPFSTQQILLHDQTEETDGDRSRQREGWLTGKGPVPKPRSVAASIGRLREVLVQRQAS